MYTVQQLKTEFTSFREAKVAHNLTARSWAKLAEKLNSRGQEELKIKELEKEVADLKAKLIMLEKVSDLDILLSNLVYKRGVGSNEVFESPEAMTDEPPGTGKDDWAYFETTLKRRYHRLAKRYHPDNGGSDEHMNNLSHSYSIARTFVKDNDGLGI